jgi:carboxyl-terminal processing protease
MSRARIDVRPFGAAQFSRAAALWACAAILACSGGEPSYESQFDAVWQDFDQTYPYFGVKQVDWTALREKYRPGAASATSERELVSVLVGMLGELHDLHVVVLDPAGRQLPTWVRSVFKNYDPGIWGTYLSRWKAQTRGNWGYAAIGSVPYFYVANWSAPLDGFDAALEQFKDAPGMIIDVRMNPGGNGLFALAVVERLTDRTRLGGYVRYRNGPGHDDFTAPAAGYFSPGGPWQFTRPVLLLIGRGSASSSEDFTCAMRELPQVTLAGDTTAGSTGNPTTRTLEQGWSYRISQWFFTTPDGIVVEDHGIPPHVAIAAAPADFAAGVDPVLEYAAAWASNPTVLRPAN